MKSIILVIIQFSCLIYFIICEQMFYNEIIVILIQIIAVVIGIMAVLTIKLDNFQILPDVKEKARLVTRGIYAYVRHPMYLAICLLTFSLLIGSFSVSKAIVSLILIINLIIKLNFEEKLLKIKFITYVVYIKTSYKLIPFIY